MTSSSVEIHLSGVTLTSKRFATAGIADITSMTLVTQATLVFAVVVVVVMETVLLPLLLTFSVALVLFLQLQLQILHLKKLLPVGVASRLTIFLL